MMVKAQKAPYPIDVLLFGAQAVMPDSQRLAACKAMINAHIMHSYTQISQIYTCKGVYFTLGLPCKNVR